MDIRERIQTWLFNFLQEFMQKRSVASSARIFTAPGTVVADKARWPSFVLTNAGTADVILYEVKRLPPGESMEFGPYFNFSMRADRIPFRFDGAGTTILELWYDQYLPNVE